MLVRAWVATAVIAPLAVFIPAWAQRSERRWALAWAVMAAGMLAELWLAELWRHRSEAWEGAYWRDTTECQKQLSLQVKQSGEQEMVRASWDKPIIYEH